MRFKEERTVVRVMSRKVTLVCVGGRNSMRLISIVTCSMQWLVFE